MYITIKLKLMVFVTLLFFLSTLIVLILTCANNFLILKKNLKNSIFSIVYNQSFLNAVYLYILIFCFSIQSKITIIIGIILFFVFSYSQKFT